MLIDGWGRIREYICSDDQLVVKLDEFTSVGGWQVDGKIHRKGVNARLARLESDVDVQETDRILKDWESVGGIRMGGEGRR